LRSGLVVACAVVALAACGGGGEDGYPQESIDAFVRECNEQPNADQDQCRCVVERLQETMPYEEFERADVALKENREPPAAAIEKLRAAVTACSTS
jgi:hypothetical protein